MKQQATWLFALAFALVGSTAAGAGKPGGGGGGGGGKAPPSPDIAYLSDDGSTDALTQAAVRGIVLATGTDVSLQKSKAGRAAGAIAWSPDGRRMAWIEVGLGMVGTPVSIVVAAPGSRPVTVYTAAPGDGNPRASTVTDSLAWVPDCTDTAVSHLVFAGDPPAGVYALRMIDGQPVGTPSRLMATVVPPENVASIFPHAFAVSPTGRHLAFAGSGSTDPAYGVWLLPLCTSDHTPFRLLSLREIGGTGWAPVMSMDWSRHGERLALSVVTGTDSNYPWRDLKIAALSYTFDAASGVEQVSGSSGIWTVDLSAEFGAASSEHSPQWGPSPGSGGCQRIAFSQSSDAGRAMYLLDIGDGSLGGCDINSPQPLNARWPRALDWK
jgi:hypothetical protein